MEDEVFEGEKKPLYFDLPGFGYVRDLRERLKEANEKIKGLGQELDEAGKRERDLEQRLAEFEEKTTELQEKVEEMKKMAVIEVDKRGVITRANPLAEEKLGYKEDELKGKPFVELCEEEADVKYVAFIPTLGGKEFGFPGGHVSLTLKTQKRSKKSDEVEIKPKTFDVVVEIDYANNQYDGATLYIRESGWFGGRKRYRERAPKVLDKDFKERILGDQIIVRSVKEEITTATIDFRDTEEFPEDILNTLVSMAVGKNKLLCEIRLKNVPDEIEAYLVKKKYPGKYISARESSPSKQNDS